MAPAGDGLRGRIIPFLSDKVFGAEGRGIFGKESSLYTGRGISLPHTVLCRLPRADSFLLGQGNV